MCAVDLSFDSLGVFHRFPMALPFSARCISKRNGNASFFLLIKSFLAIVLTIVVIVIVVEQID